MPKTTLQIGDRVKTLLPFYFDIECTVTRIMLDDWYEVKDDNGNTCQCTIDELQLISEVSSGTYRS